MRITKVETHKFWATWCNWLLVSVSTDEGLTGWGEGSLHGAIGAVETAVHELAPVLEGHEFRGTEAHWQDLYHGWRWRGGAIQNTALSALDLALWDLEGQRLGVPVHRLLGGALRDRIPTYASHWLQCARTPEQAREGAAAAVELGYSGFKFSIDAFWNPGNEIQSIGRLRDFLAGARDGAGPDVEIYIECAELLSAPAATRLATALAPGEPAWLEEPIPFENPRAMADLQHRIEIPIASGERLLSRWEFRELLESGGIGIAQPDLMHAGGLTEVRKIASLADTYYVPIAPHNPAGPVATLAGIHLAAAIPNFRVLEIMADEADLRSAVCPSMPKVEDGYFAVPDRPGLGAEIDLDAIASMPYQQQPLLANNRPWWR